MDCSNRRTLGKVREAFRDGRTARFNWRVPDCSRLRPGHYSSPYATYLNMKWCLGIRKDGDGMRYVYLGRENSPDIVDWVRYTMVWKTADGGHGVVARDQFYTELFDLPGGIHQLFGTPSQREVTLSCTLWKDDEPHSPGVFRETDSEGASCSYGRKDEHVIPGSKGTSRDTRTNGASCSNDRKDEIACSPVLL